MTESSPRLDLRAAVSGSIIRPTGASWIGIMALAALCGLANAQPALADRAAPAPTIETPYGRAPLSFADLVDKVKESVVSVYITTKSSSEDSTSDSPNSFPDLPDDHPLNQFFKKFKKDKGEDKSVPGLKAQGSGFIISEDGLAVTNNHVIDDAAKIEVSFDDDQRIPAELVGADPRTDLALIKLKTDRKLKPVAFAKKQARVGDWVLAIGNPFGLGGTVTAGIVSARARDIGSGPYDYLQIDAAVNKGNSGGPTFNLDGEVVGVNSAIFSPSGGNVGIAFAVPSDLVEHIVNDLRTRGSVARGWLGVHIQNVSDDIAGSLGLSDAHGALITKITDQGPAAGTDLKVGDAVISLNGERIDNSRSLARHIADLAPGIDAHLKVFRDGQEHEIVIKLGQFPDEKQLAKLEEDKSVDAPAAPETEDLGDIGLSLAPASVLGKSQASGVLITKVAEGSEGADKGLVAGDIILEVAGQVVSSPSEVASSVSEAKKQGRKAILARIKSGTSEKFVPLRLSKG